MHTQDNVVNWIGQIPGHWRLQRIKSSIESVINGVWGEEPANDGNDTICVRVADFNRTTYGVEMDNPTFRKIDRKDLKNRCLRPGDLLIEKSGGSGDLNPVGFVVRYTDNQPAVCSNFIARIRLKPCADSNYFKYLFAAAYNTGINKKSIKQTTGIQNLDTESYFSEKVPFPPLEDQKVIAAFLDQQTAKLDQLVEKKQRLIHLLQEKRQALITQAVTKGLDPNVPMKDSGIKWLGEVPAHWRIEKLKYHVYLNPETLSENTDPEQELLYIEIGNVSSYGEISDATYYLFKNAPSRARRKVRSEDVIISTVRTYLKAITYIKDAPENLVVSTGFAVLRAKDQLLNSFLGKYVRNEGFINEIVARSVGVSYPAINASELIELWVVIPPIEEQRAIVDWLNSRLSNIDKIITNIEKQIATIQEYRQALITAAVTGQIDVLREKLAVSADPIPAGKE
jgi:Restriction endonuclease S subunits